MTHAEKMAAFRLREQRREFVCVATLVVTSAVAVLMTIYHVNAAVLAHVLRALGKL